MPRNHALACRRRWTGADTHFSALLYPSTLRYSLPLDFIANRRPNLICCRAARIGECPLLNEISQLLAKHKLIPFLGAGVSRPQLGLGAPELRSRLAETLPEAPPNALGLADVAQLIEDSEGSDALVTRLRELLYREQFDDATGTAHLLVMSLGCGLVYPPTH